MCHICDEGGIGPCGKAAEVARLDMQDLSQQYSELQSETTLTESFEAHVNKDGADISKCPFLNNIGFAAVQLASSPEQMQSESRGPSIKELLAEKRRQKAELQVMREEPITNDRVAPVIAEIDQAMTENIQTLSQAHELVDRDQSQQIVVQQDPGVLNITALDELVMREQQQAELLSVAVPDLAPRKTRDIQAVTDELTVSDVVSDLPDQPEVTPTFNKPEVAATVIEEDPQLPIEDSTSLASDQVAEVSFIAPEIETDDLADDVHGSAEHTQVITVLPKAPISPEEPIVTSNEMIDHEPTATELLTELLPDEVKVPLEQFVTEITETEPTFSESMIEVLSIIESLPEQAVLSDIIENIIELKEEVAQLLDVDSELLSDTLLRQVLLIIQKQLEVEPESSLFDIAYRNRVGTSEYRRASMQFKSTNYTRASRYLLALVRNQPVFTLQTA